MTSIAVNIALGITIPAFIALLLWHNHKSLLAKYDSITARKKVVVPMSANPTYYFVGRNADRRIPDDLIDLIYRRDHEKCKLCGVGVFRGNANSLGEHLEGIKGDKPGNVDHQFIPASYRGPAIAENLCVLCQKCNVKKSNQIDDASLLWLARRGETICLKGD